MTIADAVRQRIKILYSVIFPVECITYTYVWSKESGSSRFMSHRMEISFTKFIEKLANSTTKPKFSEYLKKTFELNPSVSSRKGELFKSYPVDIEYEPA